MLGCQTAGVGDRVPPVPTEGEVAGVGEEVFGVGNVDAPLAGVGSERTWGFAAVWTRGALAKSRDGTLDVAVLATGAELAEGVSATWASAAGSATDGVALRDVTWVANGEERYSSSLL